MKVRHLTMNPPIVIRLRVQEKGAAAIFPANSWISSLVAGLARGQACLPALITARTAQRQPRDQRKALPDIPLLDDNSLQVQAEAHSWTSARGIHVEHRL